MPTSERPGTLLAELGFVRDGGHPSFTRRAYTLETGMLVEGDHATDRAALYYAEEEELAGLFYAPTILEELLTVFEDEAYLLRLLARLRPTVGSRLRLLPVGGTPMIYAAIPEGMFTRRYVEVTLSGLRKLVGILDYLLPARRTVLRKRRGNAPGSPKDPL